MESSASVGGVSFLAVALFIAKGIGQATAGSVVGGVNDDRLLPQSVGVQSVDNAPHALVRIGRHVAKMFILSAATARQTRNKSRLAAARQTMLGMRIAGFVPMKALQHRNGS